MIYWRGQEVMPAKDIRLIGPQNVENALAAIAAAKLSGVTNDAIKKVLTTFSGVRHRLQYVMEYQERLFYNDSKSTDIEATEVALQGFDRPVVRSEEHTSELQSRFDLVCRLLLEKKKVR